MAQQLIINFNGTGASYKVGYKLVGAGSFTYIGPNPTSSPVTVNGLTPGTYQVEVTQICSNGAYGAVNTATQSITSNALQAKYSSSKTLACAIGSTSTVYSTSSSITTGAIMYYTPNLSLPIQDMNVIVNLTGHAYDIDSSGVVGSALGTC